MISFAAKITRRMNKAIALSAGFIFAATVLQAEPPVYLDDKKIAGFEYGLVCKFPVSGSKFAPDTDAGEINIIDGEVHFSAHGTVIPAILGMSFGIKSILHQGDQLDGVVFKVVHPPLLNSGRTEQSWIGDMSSQYPASQLYSFDLPSELVTGIWTISAHKDGALLYSVAFDVVWPKDSPEYLKKLCMGLDLFS